MHPELDALNNFNNITNNITAAQLYHAVLTVFLMSDSRL